jgi:hypothetical protein
MNLSILADVSNFFHFVLSWWKIPLLVLIIRGAVYLAKTLPKYPPPPNLKPEAKLLSPEPTAPASSATGSAQNGIVVGGYPAPTLAAHTTTAPARRAR